MLPVRGLYIKSVFFSSNLLSDQCFVKENGEKFFLKLSGYRFFLHFPSNPINLFISLTYIVQFLAHGDQKAPGRLERGAEKLPPSPAARKTFWSPGQALPLQRKKKGVPDWDPLGLASTASVAYKCEFNVTVFVKCAVTFLAHNVLHWRNGQQSELMCAFRAACNCAVRKCEPCHIYLLFFSILLTIAWISPISSVALRTCLLLYLCS